MKKKIAGFLRFLLGSLVFRKRLPTPFGDTKVFVTPRADIRFLKPGLEDSGGDLFAVVRELVEPGQVIWDLGSNLGLFSFAAAAQTGTTGQVYSLEADPRYADLQTRSIKKQSNTLKAAPVTVLCAAIADGIGILDLIIPKNGHARNHLAIVQGNSAMEASIVKQVVTLNFEFLLNHWPDPDFVKIDVEGAELLVMENCKNLLSGIRPSIYIESSDRNQKEITRILKEANYQLFKISPSGEMKTIDSCGFNTLALPL